MTPDLREVKEKRPGLGLIDRAVRYVSPAWGARREWARFQTRQAELRGRILSEVERAFRAGRGYGGASKSVGYSDWLPGSGSPDEDILPDLELLRSRSRDLIRNDTHAAGLIDTWTNNIVGQGLVPQSRIDREELGLTEAQAREFEKAAERVYSRWAPRADVTGRLSAAELQALVLRQVFESGDTFAIPRPKGRGRYNLAVQVVEADRVATPMDRISDKTIREGIRVGPDGEHLRYYVKRTHPGDTQSEGYKTDDFAELPAEDAEGRQVVHHVYRMLRPDQTRGVPFLAPALLLFHDLKQYFRAELIGAKVAACYALFITSSDPYAAAAASAESPNVAGAGGAPKTLLQPGMIEHLGPGEQIQGFLPNRPNSAFSAFVERILRGIGCSIQTPYELVAQDFSKTTYTSGRMALTEVRRIYRMYQRWLVEKLLQPLWTRLLLEAYLLGDLPAPRFLDNFEAYTKALWVGPGWAWVDPAKEVAATVQSLESNLTTLAEECASRGLDWEDVLEQRAREKARMEELGLTPAEIVSAPADAGNQEDQNDETQDPAEKVPPE